MPKEKVPFDTLKQYIPGNSYDLLMPLIYEHKVHLTITKKRESKLGDYRNAHSGKHHRITINADLDKYTFLITLIHELAHLLVFEKHGNNVQAHGKEWKSQYAELLKGFIQKLIFPQDIIKALEISINNPAATSCAEDYLSRVLRNYSLKKSKTKMIEEVEEGKVFSIENGRRFIKGTKLRKRFKCQEVSTRKWFLFSPVYEVHEEKKE